MKMIRHNIPAAAVLFTILLVHGGTVRGQSCSMGSMQASTDSSVAGDRPALDSGRSHKSNLALSVRDGDSTWIVQGLLTCVDSTGCLAAVPKVTVSFFVQRLFGLLPVGEEFTATTDDSGHAEQTFPKDLPGDVRGTLTLVARVDDNDQTGPIEARTMGNWGAPVHIVADPFPRALWEPRAPIPMILTFCILLGGVWVTYGFILSQLVHIKKGNTSRHDEL